MFEHLIRVHEVEAVARKWYSYAIVGADLGRRPRRGPQVELWRPLDVKPNPASVRDRLMEDLEGAPAAATEIHDYGTRWSLPGEEGLVVG